MRASPSRWSRKLWLVPVAAWLSIVGLMAGESRVLSHVHPPASLPYDQVAGNPHGRVTLYVYEAPDCEFCEKWDEQERRALERSAQDVRIIYRTILLWPQTLQDATALLCQREAAGSPQNCEGPGNLQHAILDNTRQAAHLGITATPSFITGDVMMRGYRPASDLMKKASLQLK
ncbi:hypothetical protein AD929_12775 [Gluconobacter potus]|uniref:Thioredoxin-like fold domain-containing protein n=1 Tax=Gluconobacter potus TaxID=2724927 RepID=A0A149QS51_9PROT|nr:DsbA family protein [Gluconobacter potus]KXV00091.1 hypothetical protein AD929_12775 [Gluconobacter potus]